MKFLYDNSTQSEWISRYVKHMNDRNTFIQTITTDTDKIFAFMRINIEYEKVGRLPQSPHPFMHISMFKSVVENMIKPRTIKWSQQRR